MRKALFTEEEVRAMHAEMTVKDMTYTDFVAEKGISKGVLYSGLRKYNLEFKKLKRGRPAAKKVEVTV